MAAEKVETTRLHPGFRRWKERSGGSVGDETLDLRSDTLEHEHSGVRLVTFHAPGPLFSATIVVRTLPIDNSGHPHCLEHLTFLGSQSYPHRGYLDTLATLCYSNGTNAYTAEDHTAYTVTTAGVDGFFQVLPVLLDHVVNPTLTRESFLHEVYDGEAGGVVYCEMKGRENTEGDILAQAWKRELFQGTFLEFDSGGRTEDIERLSNDDVVNFHRKWYSVGSNISIIIGGPDECLRERACSSLAPILNRMKPELRRHENIEFNPVPFNHSVATTHFFPSADEELGSVTLAWRGPTLEDHETIAALEVLLNRYLAGSLASPLYQRFVETDMSVASEIDTEIATFPVTALVITFCGVPCATEGEEDDQDSEASDITEDVEASDSEGTHQGSLLDKHVFGKMVQDYLSEIAEGEWPGGIEAIYGAIRKQRIRLSELLENDAHEFVPGIVTSSLLHHGEDLDFGERLAKEFEFLRVLLLKDLAWWRDLLRRWFIESPHLEVALVPSTQFAETIANEALKRVEAKRNRLSEAEKETRERERRNAIAVVNQSRDLAQQEIYPNPPNENNIARVPYALKDLSEIPSVTAFDGQLAIVSSRFVFLCLTFETRNLTPFERSLLSLIAELLLASPVKMPDGREIPYTTIAQGLSDCCAASAFYTGFGAEAYSIGYATECLYLDVCAEEASFDEACELLVDSMRFGVITADRVKTVASNMLSLGLEALRSGETVTGAAAVVLNEKLRRGPKDANFSNAALLNSIHQCRVLRDVLENLEKDSDSVVFSLEEIKRKLLGQSKPLLQIAGARPDMCLDVLLKRWCFQEVHEQEATLPERTGPRLHLARTPLRCDGEMDSCVAIEVVGVEGTFAEFWVDCAVSRADPDSYALEVITEMLCRTEGPIYEKIRGNGLAYDAALVHRVWSGQLSFALTETSDPCQAWLAFLELLSDFEKKLHDNGTLDSFTREVIAAKASLLYNMHARKSSPSGVARATYHSRRLGLEPGMDADLSRERSLNAVTMADLQSCFARYLSRFRDPSRRAIAITANPQSIASIKVSFDKIGVKLCSSSIEDPLLQVPI